MRQVDASQVNRILCVAAAAVIGWIVTMHGLLMVYQVAGVAKRDATGLAVVRLVVRVTLNMLAVV